MQLHDEVSRRIRCTLCACEYVMMMKLLRSSHEALQTKYAFLDVDVIPGSSFLEESCLDSDQHN